MPLLCVRVLVVFFASYLDFDATAVDERRFGVGYDGYV